MEFLEALDQGTWNYFQSMQKDHPVLNSIMVLFGKISSVPRLAGIVLLTVAYLLIRRRFREAGLFGASFAAAWLITTIARRLSRRTSSQVDDAIVQRLRSPLRWFLIAFGLSSILPGLSLDAHAAQVWVRVSGLVVPALLGWLAAAMLGVFMDVVEARTDINVADNLRARRRRTRAGILYRIGLFLILVVSGTLLMFYYVPSVEMAYGSMKDLEFVVSFGLVLRNAHRWSAHAMVMAVFLHMCRVFYTGSYKAPREFNWVIGVCLLLLTLFLSFTGYLLPWDQLAFWAVTVGSNMASYLPWIGDDVRFLMLGGNEVGQMALLRFYVLHVVVLPLLLAILVGVHFWRIRKDGGLSRPPKD